MLLSWTLLQCKSTPYLSSASRAYQNFSANIDTTGVQNMIDTRKQLEAWRDGPVEFHFANILSPWVRRGLIAGGFGTGEDTSPVEVAPVVPPQNSKFANATAQPEWQHEPGSSKKTGDLEAAYADHEGKDSAAGSTEGPLISTLTPLFHVDLASAVRSAERTAKRASSSS